MLFEQLIAWTFNLMLFGGDLLLLVGLARYPKLRTLIVSGLALTFASLLLAVVLGQDQFLRVRLMAYTLFAHVPLVLLAAAGILVRTKPRTAFGLLILVGGIAAVAVDAFIIEPHWLMESRVKLTSEKIQQPLRVVIVADLQTDRFGDYERDVFKRIVDAQPDVILMAGDYLQVDGPEVWDQLRQDLNNYLREINFSAPLGVYAVRGNVDHPQWVRLFEGLPIQLVQDTQSFEPGPIRVTGLQVMDSFDRNLQIDSSPRFHIVVGHAPDFALGQVDGDLLVAGHTHGGQVCLPWFGPLVTATQVPRAWATGVTKVDDERTLVVSRGIGMERRNAPRLRFLCRPELIVLDVVPATSEMTVAR